MRKHPLFLVQLMMREQRITQFKELFLYVSPSALANGLALNYNRFKKCEANPLEFTLTELGALASLLKSDRQTILSLVLKHKPSAAKNRKIVKKAK